MHCELLSDHLYHLHVFFWRNSLKYLKKGNDGLLRQSYGTSGAACFVFASWRNSDLTPGKFRNRDFCAKIRCFGAFKIQKCRKCAPRENDTWKFKKLYDFWIYRSNWISFLNFFANTKQNRPKTYKFSVFQPKFTIFHSFEHLCGFRRTSPAPELRIGYLDFCKN